MYIITLDTKIRAFDGVKDNNLFNFKDIEQKTRTFLETLQKQGGPPIYTLSPKEACAVLSNLQASNPVAMLPSDIESRTIPPPPLNMLSGKKVTNAQKESVA